MQRITSAGQKTMEVDNMKFGQLSIGEQFRTVQPITFHTTRDIFTRVDTHEQPLAEQRACNAIVNGVLVQLADNVDVTRVSAKQNVSVRSESLPDITSGLGIGGYGSDDYSMATENVTSGPQFSHRKSSGQLWEPCAKRGCNNEPSCLDCGYCLDKHCHCGE